MRLSIKILVNCCKSVDLILLSVLSTCIWQVYQLQIEDFLVISKFVALSPYEEGGGLFCT